MQTINNIGTFDIKSVAAMYEKHSPDSIPSTKASDNLLSVSNAEMTRDLKRALMLAIDCGNFDKALFILMRMKEMGLLT
jgi:hypothetical protein